MNFNSVKSKLPLVSIITVTLNSEKYLEDTIKSVINQTYPNIEYIIIDGGSTDKTIDIIKKHEKYISKWISEPDEGIYEAMNKGINMCTGEIIGIINSDDWYEKDTVETIVYQAERNPDYGVFHGNIVLTTIEGELFFCCKADLREKKIWTKMTVWHPTCFIRKSIYNEYGLFSVNYKIAGDYEFILRLKTKGIRFLHIDKVLANMRIGGISSNEEVGMKENRDITIKYGYPVIKANFNYLYRLLKYRIRRSFDILKSNGFFYFKKWLLQWHVKDN